MSTEPREQRDVSPCTGPGVPSAFGGLVTEILKLRTTYLVHPALCPPRPLPYHRVERAEQRAQVPLLAVRPLVHRRSLGVHLLHILLLPQLPDRPVALTLLRRRREPLAVEQVVKGGRRRGLRAHPAGAGWLFWFLKTYR